MHNALHADEETSGTSPRLCLQLYINGDTPHERRVIERVRSTFEQKFEDGFELTVIDVVRHPELAQEARILVTPTLVKSSPSPVQRMIGDFSRQQDIVTELRA